jgi:hypothetical protein
MRYVNPVPQYFTNDGKVLALGTVQFFKSGTSSPLTTYADSVLSIPNPNPVVLDAAGRLPNTFFEGSAKIQIRDASGTLIKEVDPVGGEQQTGEWALWDANITYDVGSIVKGTDGKFYISIIASNINNDPTAPSPTAWSEARILTVWNTNESYSINDVVQDSVGNLWASQTNSNQGNDPTTDSGTNWKPAVNGAKIAEITTLEDRTTKVIGQTGGGTLTAKRTNELRDPDTGYLLPLANSVAADVMMWITLPARYPVGAVVTRSGSDTIEDESSDTSITFAGPTAIQLTSDGVSKWTVTRGNT